VKKSNESSPTKVNSLECYMANYVEYCEACGGRIVIHAFRRETKQFKKSVCGHCETTGCRKRMMEVRYIETTGSKLTCEICEGKIMVTGSRERMNGNKAAVYGHCETNECRKKGEEICFLGASLIPKRKRRSYDQKVAVIKGYMNAQRIPMGRQVKNVHEMRA
jgi:hypothetical protein